MPLLNYDQQYDYLNKLVQACKKAGIPKETTIALAINAAHESYLNPWTIEGAINPGPPLGANGWDDGASGGGLWQWTPFAGKITLGDFDGQVAFMISYKQQWDITGSWFRAAGLPDPTPKIENFDQFLYNQLGYDSVALTKAFIGYWERPAYNPGTIRYNTVQEEVAEIEPLVNKYWGNTGNEKPSEGSPGGGGSGSKNPEKPDKEDIPNDNVGLSDAIKSIVNEFLKKYDDAMKKQVYMMDGGKNTYSNSSVKVMKTYNNLMTVKMTNNFIESLKKLMDESKQPSNKPPSPPPETKPDNPPNNPPDEPPKNMDGIYNWALNNLGQTFNYPAAHPGSGPQCVDLIKALSEFYLPGNPLAPALSYGNAQDIYSHDLPAGWEHVQGDIGNDDNAKKIWDSLPNGAIVFWLYSEYGHVGIKAGNNGLDTINQNYNGTPYVTRDDIWYWQHVLGAGFLGAWITK